MKKQVTSKLALKKLAIAKISRGSMHNIKGGDCLLTEPGWYDHMGSRNDCNDVETP